MLFFSVFGRFVPLSFKFQTFLPTSVLILFLCVVGWGPAVSFKNLVKNVILVSPIHKLIVAPFCKLTILSSVYHL